MKKVKLVCPTHDPIEVSEEHAKRILESPLNKIAKWERLDEGTKKKDAKRVANKRNKGTAEKPVEQGQDKQRHPARSETSAT